MRQGEIYPELSSFAHDIGLSHLNQRSANRNVRAIFHARFGGQTRHFFERPDKFWPTVWISRIVERIHADEDVRRRKNVSVSKRKSEKDGVARRYIGRRNAAYHIVMMAILWDFRVARQGRAAQYTQIDVDGSMLFRVQVFGHSAGRFQFNTMALAIVEREAITLKSLLARYRKASGGIKSPAEEADGALRLLGHRSTFVPSGRDNSIHLTTMQADRDLFAGRGLCGRSQDVLLRVLHDCVTAP